MTPEDLEPMSPGMKSLLDSERALDVVPSATRAKLFAKVSTSVAGLAAAHVAVQAVTGSKAVAGTAAASATTATATATATAVGTKVLIAAIAFSVGGGVGATVHSVVAKPVSAPAPIVITLPATPPPLPEAPLEVPEPEAAAAPALAAPKAKPRPPTADNLGAERSLVEQARAALSRHDAAPALLALAQHEREYPNGQLAEERLALQVLAHAENGDAAKARELAAKFRAKHPASLLMPAVDAAAPR